MMFPSLPFQSCFSSFLGSVFQFLGLYLFFRKCFLSRCKLGTVVLPFLGVFNPKDLSISCKHSRIP